MNRSKNTKWSETPEIESSKALKELWGDEYAMAYERYVSNMVYSKELPPSYKNVLNSISDIVKMAFDSRSL